MLEEHDRPVFAGDLGFHAVQAIPGVGPVLAAIFVAEIGDISRFTSARTCAAGPG
jgi:transposase